MLRVTKNKKDFIPVRHTANGVRLSFDYEPFYELDGGDKRETDLATWTETIITPKPTFQQAKTFILDYINGRTTHSIESGFKWRDMSVWLSTENQFNYKAAYDFAVQTGGANLPTVFKFGDTENPVYYKFDNLDDLTDFYTKAMTYVNEQLAIGWHKKDSIDWSAYEEALR